MSAISLGKEFLSATGMGYGGLQGRPLRIHGILEVVSDTPHRIKGRPSCLLAETDGKMTVEDTGNTTPSLHFSESSSQGLTRRCYLRFDRRRLSFCRPSREQPR